MRVQQLSVRVTVDETGHNYFRKDGFICQLGGDIRRGSTRLAHTIPGSLLVRDRVYSSPSSPFAFISIAVASANVKPREMGIALGALWEVAEWLADFVLPMDIVPGIDDTITDIILDSAGALLAALFNLWGLNERVRAERKAQRKAKATQPV